MEVASRSVHDEKALFDEDDNDDDEIVLGRTEEDDAQGKAGGLGEVDMHTEDTGAPFTKKWDRQIRMTAANVGLSSLPWLT